METLPFYKKYFNIPYNLPKLDLVAAPDFPIGMNAKHSGQLSL